MDELSVHDCKMILQSYSNENYELISCNIKPYCERVVGFLGKHYLIEIRYKFQNEVKSHTFFMKTLRGVNEMADFTARSANSFGKEEFIYKLLFKKFEAIGIDTSFAPKYYFHKPDLIVLENMLLSNFRSCAKMKFLDYDHCQSALKSLAKFHSSSIVYQYFKSKEMKTRYRLNDVYPTELKNYTLTKENNVFWESFQYSVSSMQELTNLVPENHIKADEFSKKLHDFNEIIPSIVKAFSEGISSILHGDLWYSNFLFKYKNSKPIESIIIDYQAIRYGPPSLDVIYFLYQNTRKEFRDKYFNELVDYYYECFKHNLVKHNLVETIEKSKYIDLRNDYKILMKMLCVYAHCVILTDSATIEWIMSNSDGYRNFFLKDRCRYILNNFTRGGLYKEVVEEDMLELRDLLFQ